MKALILLAGCVALAGCSASIGTKAQAPPPPTHQAAEPDSGMPPSSHRTADLADVQQKLTEDGDYHGVMDGRMGPATAAAIRAYQRSHDLPVTGLADDATRAKMGL